MGISLKGLEEKKLRCPMMNGTECLGPQCMLWAWENDGNPHYIFTHIECAPASGGEWEKDGTQENIIGVLEQRWKHPATGHCGLCQGAIHE